MKLPINFPKALELVRERFKNKIFSLFIINAGIVAFQILYILLRYSFINDQIPLWYTKIWGDMWLAPKSELYLIPVTAVTIFLLGLILLAVNKYYIKYFYELVGACVIFCNIFLSASLIRIIHITSTPFTPLIDPLLIPLIPPFVLAFLLTYIALPYFIDFAHSKKLITNPLVHAHPAMILQSPSARGGGLVYSVVFLIIALLFVGFVRDFIGLYISVLMVGALGIIDDFQNTHPSSSFKIFENPFLRLFLLFLSILPTVFSGFLVTNIANPLGGVLVLESYKFLPLIFSAVWMVWVMNVLSWSNGVDGQYSGIVGISSLIIAILALRFKPLEPVNIQAAMLAAISAGAAFGFTKYNWHPSKVMWGFGAMSAGLVISALSISIRSKILTSILIILIPFMDALVTAIRRVLQGKNPLSGDRGHLHHLLLERGWSVQKIARFYWFTTALFGAAGLLLPERYSIQAALTIIGIVAFIIIVLNLISAANKHPKPELVSESPKATLL